ncbi:hypothetical protein ACGFMK_04365 [Amycolatopsis sp. NPDC049252]|uniref:hypothetical protein n=1 Tax=Amycolatopsis sp. NPDC049252 TaxID=3363933 RepID=UPI00371CDF8D
MGEGPVYDPGGNWQLPGPNGVPRAGFYGAAGSGVGGPGFQYDEATLQELVREWRDLAAEFRTDLAHAEVLARAQGPGLEYASGGNAELIRSSGESLYSTLQQRIDYCETMANKYVTALGKYATAEETHATEIGNTPKGII